MIARAEEKLLERDQPPPLRLERRLKPRVAIPFRARVSGRDKAGAPFEVTSCVDNIGRGGLYMRIGRDVSVGTRLLINVFMSHEAGTAGVEGMRLEVYGLVERVDAGGSGDFGVAVSFTNSVML